MRVASWVTIETTQIANVSGVPISAATGTSTPRTRIPRASAVGAVTWERSGFARR